MYPIRQEASQAAPGYHIWKVHKIFQMRKKKIFLSRELEKRYRQEEMISSTTWVPRGFAKEFPEKYEPSEEELDKLAEMLNLQISEAQSSLTEAEKEHGSLRDQIEIDDDLKEYDLDNYDNEEEEDEGTAMHMFPGLANSEAKYHENEESDPYVTLPNDEEIKEEKEELQIYPSDNLVLATRTEDEVSYLDVYVYDDGEVEANGDVRGESLYVHHDMMLPAFPLCVEWINFDLKLDTEDKIGNFAAVGTFDPTIEIWNLDYIDKSFPDIILGEMDTKVKKKKKKNVHITTHHTDAVLSLAHNKTHRSILASTSADLTVKLWDLSTEQLVRSMNHIHHMKQVSSSQWFTNDASILLTGGYDSTVALSDVRINDLTKMTKNYKVGDNEDVEIVKFGSDSFIYAGTDKGNVYCFDVKNESKPVWTLHLHDAGISTLETNYHIPGMILTGAMGEKQTKVWKVTNQKSPSMLLSRDFGCGNVLTASFAPDMEVSGNVVIGGVTGGLKLWDSFSNRSVRSAFRSELKALKQKAYEEGQQIGSKSKLSGKYDENDDSGEKVMEVEGGLDEEEDDEEEDGDWEDEE